MKLSIIMSVHNSKKYLREAIESVLNQTFRDFVFIIVNDCSTDGSGRVLEEYAKTDSRIILINNAKNMGLTKSLNIALNYADSEFIARMDADDICINSRFEHQIEFMEENTHIHFLGSCAINIDEYGNVISNRTVPQYHNDIKKVLPIVNPMIHPSVVYRTKAINELGGYNEEHRVVQDYDLWFRAISKGYKFHNLQTELLKYRINNNYHQRKSSSYRMKDLSIRFAGYKKLKLPIYSYVYLTIPLLQILTPEKISRGLFNFLKRFDPR